MDAAEDKIKFYISHRLERENQIVKTMESAKGSSLSSLQVKMGQGSPFAILPRAKSSSAPCDSASCAPQVGLDCPCLDVWCHFIVRLIKLSSCVLLPDHVPGLWLSSTTVVSVCQLQRHAPSVQAYKRGESGGWMASMFVPLEWARLKDDYSRMSAGA